MAKDLFSVPIFFIVFRETLEAAIIVSVLLGLVEQIVYHIPASERGTAASDDSSSRKSGHGSDGQPQQEALTHEEDSQVAKRRLIRKLRIQVIWSTVFVSFPLTKELLRFSSVLDWACSLHLPSAQRRWIPLTPSL